MRKSAQIGLLLLAAACRVLAQSIPFQYFYDDLNQLAKVVDSTGVVIQYVYDPVGDVRQINRSTAATAPPAIKVTSINGISINANSLSFPDATLNTTGPVAINTQSQYIPVGTIPKIYVYGENGADQTITCYALTGTLRSATCSASIAFVNGGWRAL